MDCTTIISFPCKIDGFESRVLVEDTLRLSAKKGIDDDVAELEALRQRNKGQIYNDPSELFDAPDEELLNTDCFPPKMWIFPQKKYMIAFAGSNANSIKLQIEFQRIYANLELNTRDGRKQFLEKFDLNADQLLTCIAKAMMAAEEDALKRIVINKPDDAKDLIRYVQWNGIGLALFATTEKLPAWEGVCTKCRSCTRFPRLSPLPTDTHLYKIRPIYSISVDQLLQTVPAKIQLELDRYELTRVHDKFLIYGAGENLAINQGRKSVLETLLFPPFTKEKASDFCYQIMEDIFWQQGDFKIINPRIEGGILSTNPAVKRIIPLKRPRWFEGPLNMLKQLKEWVLARLFPNPPDLHYIISYEIPPYEPREG